MYSTCLFCSGALGTNAAIEHFPVGRRLAFDATKGRLWVVCRRCERWNLTPLEERWEAVEECERAFRETRLRISTDQIGLARVREGLELVRIGTPQRPEMAAWRYGDQFGKRRRRNAAMVAAGIAAAGVAVVAGPVLGLVSITAAQPLWQLVNGAHVIYRSQVRIAVPGPDGATLHLRLRDLNGVRIDAQGDRIVLGIPGASQPTSPWWRYERRAPSEVLELEGELAVRAAGAILPRMNGGGGSSRDVERAVELLQAGRSPEDVFVRAAAAIARTDMWNTPKRGASILRAMHPHTRLALEMASHEEAERRALEGELYLLEEAWREAEEIAAVADDLLLPPGAQEFVDRHRPR